MFKKSIAFFFFFNLLSLRREKTRVLTLFISFLIKEEEKKTIKAKFLGLGAVRTLARVSSWVIIWHLAPLFPALVISREIKMLSSYLPASSHYTQRPWEGPNEMGRGPAQLEELKLHMERALHC